MSGTYCSECGREDPVTDDGYTACCNQPTNDVGGRDEAGTGNRWGWRDSRGTPLSQGDVIRIRERGQGDSEWVVLLFSPPELLGVAADSLAGWDGRDLGRILHCDSAAEVRVVGHEELPDGYMQEKGWLA